MALERVYPRALLGLLCASAAFVSCGERIKNKKPTFPVTGKVLVQSRPAAGAMLIFRPAAGSTEPEEWIMGFPRARVKEDGTFAVATYGVEDGAPAGDYIVLANWPRTPEGDETAGSSGGQAQPNDRLEDRYMDPATSTLRAKVEAKPNNLPPFKLD